MKKVFTVIGCTPSNENTTFVWKLVTTAEVTVFGIKKNVNRTYYIGGMPSEVPADTKITEDLNKFEIVERPFEHPETGETIMCKWLHAKV